MQLAVPREAAPGVRCAPRVLAVMYHYVRDADPLPLPEAGGPFDGIKGLTSSAFAAQLDALCRTMEPIDWPRMYAWMCGRESIPDRSFVLTFDDGLLDHSTAVAPVLEARGLRGVFFVPGSVLTTHRLLAPHANHLLLATLGERRVIQELAEFLERHHSSMAWHSEARTLQDASAVCTPPMYHYEQPLRARLKYFLTMRLPIPIRDAAMQAVFERHIGSSARWAKHWYLGWKDLTRLLADGHTIGGHGFAHEPLARLTPSEIAADVQRCAAVLREGLGPDLRPFSYPYGSVPDGCTDVLRDAGFAHAFTTREDWVRTGDDVYRLPRVDTIHVDQILSESQTWQEVT